MGGGEDGTTGGGEEGRKTILRILKSFHPGSDKKKNFRVAEKILHVQRKNLRVQQISLPLRARSFRVSR
jgi:hypothetical protein